MADILIIDDDEQIRRLISRILSGEGHTVHEAENGRIGLDVFHRVAPDLIITDIIMSDMEGIETILELRREHPTVPVIAISGGTGPIYLQAATHLGATASLAKPFSTIELRALVEKLLVTQTQDEGTEAP